MAACTTPHVPPFPASGAKPTAAQTPAHSGVLDGVALRRELTALARTESDAEARRKAALVHLKAHVREAHENIRRRIDSRALSGLQAARALCSTQDVVIQILYDFAVKHFYYAQNPTESERLAVVAVGGYGRGLLAPYSDIDLLFLRPFKQTAWSESVIELMLLMLWDLGLKVGHSTRSLAECLRLAGKDMTIRTALLDARYVWGDQSLFDDLHGQFRSEIASGSVGKFVGAKLAEREARHRRHGESRYLVEPNIKEGKGGLRDLETLTWIGKYVFGTGDPAELAKHAVFTCDELTTFQAAESFLWNLRCQLHSLAGRAEERLTFDVQPEIARRLGSAGDSARRAVERFMRNYFLVAKDVGDLTRVFCAALEEQNRKPRPVISRLMPGFLKLRSAADEFYVENGRLSAREGAFHREPTNLIRIFRLADDRRVDIHPNALRTITRSLDLITDRVRDDPAANRLFLDILVSNQDPERALRHMNEAGVLGRFVPPFDHAVGLMQFNMYHHYTVDEHLIRAVGILSAIEHQELQNELPLASELIRRITAREALYCAVFLHDIAKGLEGAHSDIGAAAAQTLCPRWGLSSEDTATVAWLVRNHLLMSDTAQRRDISDPKTVRDFVALVQSPELLRLLLVLTVADIRAVGPGVWNGWKAQLLRELYHAASEIMSDSATPQRSARIAVAKEKLSHRLADWTEPERVDALVHRRDNYWLAFDVARLEHHARLKTRARLHSEQFALDTVVDAVRSVCEITVSTPDRPGLFAQLSGAIAACGGTIVEAKAFTADDAWALDVFLVEDAAGRTFAEAGQVERLRDAIARALRGERPAPPAVVRRVGAHRAAVFEVSPRVTIDNEASTDTTVIEVAGADRPGLLFDLARSLFEQRMSISSAIVATYGERVMDVFYVRDLSGQKVINPEQIARIETCLKDVLADDT